MESEHRKRSKRIVAVCGKGGTGKTAFTAMMRTVLLRTGRAGKLLLIDADPAMGLTHALGVDVRRTMGQVREEIIATARRRNEEEKVQLADKLDYMTLEALTELDDFALLAMGRTETLGCFCPVNSLLRGTIETLSESFDTILIDGEAGVEQINRQVMRRADTMMIISDATSRGIKTAGLIQELVRDERVIECDKLGLVFNRVRGNEDILEKSALEMGVEVFGYIPQDEEIASRDLLGKPLADLSDSSRALAAVRDIVATHVLG